MYASQPRGMTMTLETVHQPGPIVNTPTPQPHHTDPKPVIEPPSDRHRERYTRPDLHMNVTNSRYRLQGLHTRRGYSRESPTHPRPALHGVRIIDVAKDTRAVAAADIFE